jgi:hypothetical protein
VSWWPTTISYRSSVIVETSTSPIGGKMFSMDCYGLSLGSYDMVLGVQWLESL